MEVAGGSGLSTTAKNLLITILRNGVYSTDQSANITALEKALGSGGDEPDVPVVPDEPDEPVVVTYTVTSGLTNVESTNASAVVNEGDSYTATLTAVDGYELDAVTVTMGGVDITATAYADGVVSIASVTGNVVITANAVEVAIYPFTPGEPYAITWTEGYKVNNATGTDAAESGWAVSDYLPCEGASAFSIGTGIYPNYGLFMYDADKNFLGRYGNANYPNNGYAIAMHYPAVFVRAQKTTSSTNPDTVTPVVYPVLTDSTPWESGIVYNSNMELGELNKNTGAEGTGTSWYRSDFVLCYGATTLSLHPVDTGLRATVCWYDSEKNFISGATENGHTADAVPENAHYFRFASAVYKPFFKLS